MYVGAGPKRAAADDDDPSAGATSHGNGSQEASDASGSAWVSGSFRRMESKKASRRERAGEPAQADAAGEDMTRLPKRELTFKPRRQRADNGPAQV